MIIRNDGLINNNSESEIFTKIVLADKSSIWPHSNNTCLKTWSSQALEVKLTLSLKILIASLLLFSKELYTFEKLNYNPLELNSSASVVLIELNSDLTCSLNKNYYSFLAFFNSRLNIKKKSEIDIKKN
ncbi:hypothetical protein BpHYR1_020097 [Brachionus plicatilis]|uniref:Uncharacterized protein n=1 Tax=Brachionus plicatilis TaxID=10195 RepID=A0A3M7Q128_BRAPC|nr:hypothetical protein BpHYR1_020097 [Brachionus plicatilis]